MNFIAATIVTAPEATDDTTLAMAVVHSFTTGHAWEALLAIGTVALFFATVALIRATIHLDRNTAALVENSKVELAAHTNHPVRPRPRLVGAGPDSRKAHRRY